MPTESGDRKPLKTNHLGAPMSEPEHLPCPRCDSPNTKFCYYNNYNSSQPRYFCKGCRRYWTHGGALRDIPVGGGSRKTAKRLRTNNPNVHHQHLMTAVPTATPVFLPIGSPSADSGGSVHFGGGGEVMKPAGLNVCGSFTSLLSTQAPGFMALGGFGLGFDDMGFGLGRALWPFPGVVDGGAVGGVGGGGSVTSNTWQLESGEGGFINGECFPWPDLAISTPGTGLSQMKIGN